jgi:hypothetical protein
MAFNQGRGASAAANKIFLSGIKAAGASLDIPRPVVSCINSWAALARTMLKGLAANEITNADMHFSERPHWRPPAPWRNSPLTRFGWLKRSQPQTCPYQKAFSLNLIFISIPSLFRLVSWAPCLLLGALNLLKEATL